MKLKRKKGKPEGRNGTTNLEVGERRMERRLKGKGVEKCERA